MPEVSLEAGIFNTVKAFEAI